MPRASLWRSTPFRLDLHVGDVGHTLIVGPTGAGKSVLLALLALQFRRFIGAQVIIFDRGRSARAAALAMGDALAYPAKAKPEHSHGVRFFSAVRDLTATGFFTSKIGIADLDYKGNTFVPKWTGAPKEALEHLGVSYEPLRAWYTESV